MRIISLTIKVEDIILCKLAFSSSIKEMGKKKLKTSENTRHLTTGYKSYSINEIMAAGGATAFANRMGKNPQAIANRLKKLPKDAFLTDEEGTDALKILSETK